jgi:hypothetical protein
MDGYDTSAENLRARVEKVAEQISHQLAKTPAGEQFFFICDIVNAVENVVGDVVNVAQDAVNEAVNVAHNVVNAVENIGERAVHATEEAIHAVTAHTQQVLEVAQFAVATINVTRAIVDFVGAEIAVEGTEKAATKGGARASAAQLIQARRAIILEQRRSLITSTQAKRNEIKSRIATVAARISTASRGSGG